jgi:nucleotide-binding universal stress UspA family protein
MAQRLRATLEVLAVLEPLAVVDYGFIASMPPSDEQYRTLGDALRTAVSDQLHRCGQGASEPVVQFGLVASEIARAAREHAATLIVIGLGPHHALDRALGGETALQLVQVASTPVLAVPANATALPTRVTACIDFTPTSAHAARMPLLWLEAGDVLQLVHVAARGAPSAEPGLQRLKAELARETRATVEALELRGNPARSLLEHAERSHSEVITAGTHGYGMWKRLTLGSVASKIVRLSPVAVVIAPLGSIAQTPIEPPVQ